MLLDLVQELDFTTPGDWTPSGDATISGGALTLLDPFFKCVFGSVNYWSPEPDYDPVTLDAILKLSTIHKALDGGSPAGDIALADGMFCFWAKRATNLVSGKQFSVYSRYVTLPSPLKHESRLFASAAGVAAMRWMSSAGAQLTSDVNWNAEWVIGEWRQFFVSLSGVRGAYQMGCQRDCGYRVLDRTAAGTFAFYVNDTTQSVRVAANNGEVGHPSAHACPWVCYGRSGACELNVASAFVAPAGTTGLTRISGIVETDYVVDDGEPAPTIAGCACVPIRINVYHGGAWGGWADLPADGDASATPFVEGDQLLVAIDDGAGAGLSNAVDARYVPVVHGILVGYQADIETSTKAYMVGRLDEPTVGPRGDA